MWTPFSVGETGRTSELLDVTDVTARCTRRDGCLGTAFHLVSHILEAFHPSCLPTQADPGDQFLQSATSRCPSPAPLEGSCSLGHFLRPPGRGGGGGGGGTSRAGAGGWRAEPGRRLRRQRDRPEPARGAGRKDPATRPCALVAATATSR
jgi:hypothetical protein